HTRFSRDWSSDVCSSDLHVLDYIGDEKDILIGIKPNLVVPKPSHLGATTDPRIVIAIIEYLKTHGYHNIVILESSWVGDDTKRRSEERRVGKEGRYRWAR